MNRAKDARGAKRSLSCDDGFKNEVCRLYRKRKSVSEEIWDTKAGVAKEEGDLGIKKIEITALNLPDESLNDNFLYTAPLKKRKVVHQISIEKVNAEPDQDGDTPRFNVCFRDIPTFPRNDFEKEHELLYQKTLRKAEMWRKIWPGGRKSKTSDDPEVIQKSKRPPCRFFLTFTIANDMGERSTTFLKIRSLTFYLLKFILLIISAFGTFTTESYLFSEAVASVLIRNCIFYNTEGQPNTFEGISDLGDLKNYINGCFKPGLAKGLWGKPGVDEAVTIVAEPRFRQVRVKNTSCVMSLYEDIVCYNPFSEESESKKPFGSGDPVGFVYSQSDNDVWFIGYYGSYNSNGFMYFLSDRDLLNDDWVDNATSAVFIDFTLYSADADLFCSVQFLFEFPLSGRVKSSYTARALYLDRYASEWGHFLLGVDISFVLITFISTANIFVNVAYFKWRVLRSVGLLFNCMTACFCWFGVYSALCRFFAVRYFFSHTFKLDEFTDFQPIFKVSVNCEAVIVLNLLLSSFELYGFLNIDLMSHLKITLQACFKNIIVFAFAFAVIVWAYVQVAYLLFSHSLERYRSFARCFSELMKVQLGDLDYEGPRSVFRAVGPMFILMYIISVVFVFMNMFFAIINGTFTFVANNVDIEGLSYTAFLAHCWHVLRTKYGKGYAPKTEEKKLQNSERIRNLLLDSGYSNLEIRIFFCRYIVDDDLVLDEAVFAPMWNLPIPPERLEHLKALVHELETAVDLLLHKAEWLSQRIRHIQETRLGKKKKASHDVRQNLARK